MDEKLKTFLEQQNALEKFQNNMIQNSNPDPDPDFMNSFIWKESPEGFDFWKDLYYKFIRKT
jgi:hypothetical protein